MGFDPITMGVVAGGANLIGGAMDRRANKKAVSSDNKRSEYQTQRAIGALQPAYQNAQNGLIEGYGRAGQIQQENYNRNSDLMAQSFMPRAQMFQQGNVAAQQSIVDSLPQMRAALLGGRMPQTMRPQQFNIDQNALQGILNPEKQQFPGTQQFQNIRGQ
tara:strand:+ start:536 stop:1015 length:480 start_codon:yes stop_codon:yes gene_type:complete